MKPAASRPQDTNPIAKPPESKRLYLTIDPLLPIICLISFANRYYKLDHPRAVVFDELHYIKFITLYTKRIFFFDPQPPLGKQLLALTAYMIGFEGDLTYSQIGEAYKNNIPITSLRLLPCIAGALLAPLTYLICLELNFRQITAGLVSFLIIIENSLLTQSRFILLEPIVILFSTLSVYLFLKFSRHGSSCWLLAASISTALAVSTKYSGLFTYMLLLCLTVRHWWRELENLQPKAVLFRATQYIACVTLVPAVIYLGVYYSHLAWLTKAGPHDSLMTSAFQASLEDGLASITRGQPLEIVHGSLITLRHTHGRSCWLHSHEHLYPVKYTDGRGSSHQQQVTCYSFKDVNNWWIVKRPHIDDLEVTTPHDKIKDGDLIQLIHGMTNRNLNSHDVASPMSPYSQEVSCYVDHNISMPEQDIWRVRLMNPRDTQGHWHSINSRLQLIHHNSSLALKFSSKQLPDWGFHQHEIVTDRETKSEDTVWNVEEHRYTQFDNDNERVQLISMEEFVPLEPTSLSFLEKFIELHSKLMTYQQDSIKDHMFACESPLDWILMTRGTAYWISNSPTDNAQVFLIGNIGNSTLGLVTMCLFCLIGLFYILRRRRKIFTDIKEDKWFKFETISLVILGGYFINVLPYFLYESPLFLQHYLQALVFKIIMIGAFVDHLYDMRFVKQLIPDGLVLLSSCRSLYIFIKLTPLAYGSRLAKEEVENLRWKETWQLIT